MRAMAAAALPAAAWPTWRGGGRCRGAGRSVGRAALSAQTPIRGAKLGAPTRDSDGRRAEPLRSGRYLRYGGARAAVAGGDGGGGRDYVRGGGAGGAACSAPRGASPSRAR